MGCSRAADMGYNRYAARLRALAEDSGTLWLNDAADEIERLERTARARQRAQSRRLGALTSARTAGNGRPPGAHTTASSDGG